MVGNGSYTRQPSRGVRLRLEVLLLAALLLLIALPAFGMAAKATTSHIACVRGAFQHTVTQNCK